MPAPPLLRRALEGAERTIAGLFVHRAFDHAAAMSFYFFLSLFPLLAFVGWVLAKAALAPGLAPVLARTYALLPGSSAAFVKEELERMGADAALAPVTLPVFVYLTSSGTHNLMDLLEVTAGAPPRPWLRQRGIAIVWNAGTVAAAATVAWGLLVANAATTDARRVLEELWHVPTDGAAYGGVVAALLALATAALALFFRVAVAHPPGVSRRVWPGALIAVGLFALVTWGFGVWVRTLGRYAVYYGSLAAVAVLLIWLYLSSLALLVGAEVNAQLEGLRPRYSLRP